MSADKTPDDQITEAGAVELEEGRLDDASGGLAAVQTTAVTTDTSTSAAPVSRYYFENAWPLKYSG